MIDRLAGVAGLGGVLSVFAFVAMAAPDAEPEDPAAVIADALVDNRGSARLAAYFALIAATLLMIFVARLHGILRASAGPGPWTPTVALLGGMALVGVVILEAGFAFAASTLDSYGDDPQIAKLFVLWSWESANLYAPAFAALLGGSTLVAYRHNAFPTWLQWTSAVLLGLLVFVGVVLRVPGLATAPGSLWAVLVSIHMILTPGVVAGTVDR